MTVLVVGRSGQVANALVERAGDTPLTALGRPDIDLTDPKTFQAALERVRPTAVINAAAYTAVDAAETDPETAHQVNAEAPGALARACAAQDVPFVHISTDYVFDGALDRPYREDDPVRPQSVYGRTKADGEAAVKTAGGRAIVARTAWVYSPFGKNFVKTMLRLGAERDTLNVVSDQHGNPSSAHDIAGVLLALVAQRDRWDGFDIVHVAGRGDTTWHGFARAVVAALPNPPVVNAISTAEFPTPAVRPKNSRLDGGRLKRAYGLEMPPWETSLATVLARLAKG